MTREVCEHFNPVDQPCAKCEEKRKSEALFLADELEIPLGTVIQSEVCRRAAKELRRLHAELERCKQVCAATSEAWREEAALGCDHCNQPLYAATKCRVCGRVTEPVQDTGVKLKPVFYAPRRLDDAEVEDIIKRNAAITESILNINFKEPQPGMVNLDAFHVFHFNDPPKGGFVGEIEMLKWLVRNRDGDYWKAKHGVQEPPCATRECMPSECPNCASLQDQNTELNRKLAEMEQTSLELCETCGWRTLIPGDCCLNCVRPALQEPTVKESLQVPAEVAATMTHRCKTHVPLTEEEIEKLLIESAGMTVQFSDVDLRLARAIERAHGIGGDK